MNDDLIRRGRASGGFGLDLSPGCGVCEELTKALVTARADQIRLETRVRELLFQLSFWEARTDSRTCAFANELTVCREEWLRCLVDFEIERRKESKV